MIDNANKLIIWTRYMWFGIAPGLKFTPEVYYRTEKTCKKTIW